MRKGFVIVSAVALVVLLIGSVAVAADQKDVEDRADYYGRLIDEAIAKCEAKGRLRNSWSQSVRRTAAVAHLKAAYFEEYRQELIQAMIDDNVGEKPYKVHYYLNNHFYRVIHEEPRYLVNR